MEVASYWYGTPLVSRREAGALLSEDTEKCSRGIETHKDYTPVGLYLRRSAGDSCNVHGWGWTRFMIAARKCTELPRRTVDLAAEWVIKLGQAVTDMGADCLMMCVYPGIMPIGTHCLSSNPSTGFL